MRGCLKIDEDGKYAYWGDPSLRNGPWSHPGACAGRLLLSEGNSAAREKARAFFEAAGADISQVMTGDGKYSSAAAALVFFSQLAKDTLYRAWPRAVRQSKAGKVR